jgi:hypothetical protein
VLSIHFVAHQSSSAKDSSEFLKASHPTLKFPLNLEDRVEYIKNKINKMFNKTIKFTQKNNIKNKSITLSFDVDFKINKDDLNKLKELSFTTSDKNKYSILID